MTSPTTSARTRSAPLPALLLSAALLLAACAQRPPPTVSSPPADANPAPIPAAPPRPAPTPEELSARAADQALAVGLRAYDDGQYKLAEARLDAALKLGLPSAKDQATAQKTLAFVYCSSQRLKACEAAFRAARTADPGFALTKAEAGHPVWGPVYRRTLPKR